MAKAKRKGRCLKSRLEIQDYGPAKRVCVKRAGRKVKGKRPKGWCVYKGKSPVATACFRKKSTANKKARVLQRKCKRRVKVKRRK